MTDLLLMDLWSATTGEEHPARPKRPKRSAGDASALAARLKAQQRRLAAPPAPTP